MGLLDKYLGSSNQRPNRKKFNTEFLLDILTISNSIFENYPNKRQVELEIFGKDIIDSGIPVEFQEEEIVKEEYFKKRYRISAAMTGIAIIESIIAERFESELYYSELIELKRIVFPNLLKLREEILEDIELQENEYDWRYEDNKINLENNDSSFLEFVTFTKKQSFEVKNLLSGNGESHNLLFHFDAGLGQIIWNTRPLSYGGNTKKIVRNIISQIWNLLDESFQML